jgi:3D (Asp-Asp-Asp) domain-containing protein
VIPLGTKVHVEGYGYATAADIGGGIDGNEIDVFIPEEDDALEWGRKEVTVTIID